jgi:ubiquinol-cytochrome c reductase cytochrome c subunit
MDSTTSPSPAARLPRGRTHRGKLRRRLVSVLVLAIALFATGGVYLLFAPKPQVASAQIDSAQADPAVIAKGQQLYNSNCITASGTPGGPGVQR